MKKQIVLLWMLFVFTIAPRGLYAKELGPAYSYSDLLRLVGEAVRGDTILVSGNIQADETNPLMTKEDIAICSAPDGKATISGMHILDSNLSFSDVELVDSLDIHGSSKIMLADNVRVSGNRDAAVRFKGNGELIITPSCSVIATDGANGINIEHEGGSFYAALEGTVVGGAADIGGAGVIVSPLHKEGVLLIGGNISGGNGNDIGGNAVNLYDIGGNAYISVIGSMQGGIGSIGGNGLQIISPRDTANIGIIGQVVGGEGNTFGGNAVVVLNAEDRSSIALSGSLIGGNTSNEASDPGQSLLLVGNGALDHMYSNGCLLEDGKILASTNAVQESAAPEKVPGSQFIAEPEPNKTQPDPKETIDNQTNNEETQVAESEGQNNDLPEDISAGTSDTSQVTASELPQNAESEQIQGATEEESLARQKPDEPAGQNLDDSAIPSQKVEEQAAAPSPSQEVQEQAEVPSSPQEVKEQAEVPSSPQEVKEQAEAPSSSQAVQEQAAASSPSQEVQEQAEASSSFQETVSVPETTESENTDSKDSVVDEKGSPAASGTAADEGKEEASGTENEQKSASETGNVPDNPVSPQVPDTGHSSGHEHNDTQPEKSSDGNSNHVSDEGSKPSAAETNPTDGNAAASDENEEVLNEKERTSHEKENLKHVHGEGVNTSTQKGTHSAEN